MKKAKIKAYLELMKLKITFNYGFMSFIGSFLAFRDLSPLSMALGAAIAISLAAFGLYALNDLFDLEVDRINAPERPLPSGRITENEAKIVITGFLILSLIIASTINHQVLFFTLLFMVLGIAYSVPPIRLKESLLANICVAAGFLLCILSGSNIGDTISPKAVLAAIAVFTIAIGSTSIKDLKDVNGDKRMGVRTLPLLIGPKKTVEVVAASSSLGIPLLYAEYILHSFNWIYPILITLMAIMLIRNLVLIWKENENPIICERAWKGYSLAGLPLFMAFILGSFEF